MWCTRGCAVFLGTYEPKLDDKGRVILPAKFRDQLTEGLVLSPGQERCLFVYPEEEFQRTAEELRKAPTTSKPVRAYARVFFAGSSDEKPDRQGRITIPPRLRKYAQLEKDLVVIGAGSHAEIWDADAWVEYLAQQEDQFSDIEEELVPGMF